DQAGQLALTDRPGDLVVEVEPDQRGRALGSLEQRQQGVGRRLLGERAGAIGCGQDHLRPCSFASRAAWKAMLSVVDTPVIKSRWPASNIVVLLRPVSTTNDVWSMAQGLGLRSWRLIGRLAPNLVSYHELSRASIRPCAVSSRPPRTGSSTSSSRAIW